MHQLRLILLLVATSGPLAAATARAGDLTVNLTDKQGMPLGDVVVTVAPVSVEDMPHLSAPGDVLIDQRRRKFRPWVVGIRTGSTVTFDNHDDITHHVYSFSQPRQFSFRLQAGQTREPIQFDQPGTVVIGCNIHDWMVGFIVVTDAPFVSVSNQRGSVTIEGLTAGSWRVETWHPGLDVGASGPGRSFEVTGNEDQQLALAFKADLAMKKPPDPPLEELVY